MGPKLSTNPRFTYSSTKSTKYLAFLFLFLVNQIFIGCKVEDKPIKLPSTHKPTQADSSLLPPSSNLAPPEISTPPTTQINSDIDLIPEEAKRSSEPDATSSTEMILFEHFDSYTNGVPIIPSYSQRDPTLKDFYYPGTSYSLLPNGPDQSMLCGPTSTTMILSGIINKIQDNKKISIQGWTRDSFLNQENWQEKIAQIIQRASDPNLINSNESPPLSPSGSNSIIESGTTLDRMANIIPQVKTDFVANSSENLGIDGDWTPNEPILATWQSFVGWLYGVTLPNIPKSPPKPNAYLLLVKYGHYTASLATNATQRYVKFKRNGGHFIVMSGVFYNGQGAQNAENVSFTIHDPWIGGVKQYHRIKTFTHASFQTLNKENELSYARNTVNPTGFGYFSNISAPNPTAPKNQYEIIEGYARISAPITY